MRWCLIEILLIVFALDASAEDNAALETQATDQTQAKESEPVDPASNPPLVAPSPNQLRTRISGRWRSEILMSERSQMHSLGNGRYGVRTSKVFPFYNTLDLRADEIGHPGLSIHFQGWAGLDLADIYFDQRFVADPTYLYLQFRDYGWDIKAGRQMVFGGAARGLHLDGGTITYQTPINIGFQALGGLVVSPRHGPDWYRNEESDDLDDYGSGFSDWKREGELGDWAAGGRLFYRMTGFLAVGVSFLHVTRNDEIDHQVAGADADIVPFEWAALSGDLLMAVQETELQEANVGLDIFPMDIFSVALDYRHANPTLYISRTSIFSVFSDETYDAVGGTVRVFPFRQLHLHGGYHHHFYGYIDDTSEEDDIENDYEVALESGYEIEAGAKAIWGTKGGLTLLDFQRFKQDLNGVNQFHLGVVVPLSVEWLKASLNAYLDIYDKAVHDQNLGFLGDIGIMWHHKGWETGGTFTTGMTPYAANELRGIVKVAYNWDVSFTERRQP